jgi:hypothetical protein
MQCRSGAAASPEEDVTPVVVAEASQDSANARLKEFEPDGSRSIIRETAAAN